MDFDEYVANARQPLLRLAYLLTADAHHAEDLVQAALLQAFRHWRRVNRASHPDAYVRRMLVNSFLDGRRRRSANEAPTVTGEIPDLSVADHSGAHAERTAMWAALAELPRAQRAVLVLRFYEDRDDAAIAELMGCSQSTVRSNAARGLAALRREWAHG